MHFFEGKIIVLQITQRRSISLDLLHGDMHEKCKWAVVHANYLKMSQFWLLESQMRTFRGILSLFSVLKDFQLYCCKRSFLTQTISREINVSYLDSICIFACLFSLLTLDKLELVFPAKLGQIRQGFANWPINISGYLLRDLCEVQTTIPTWGNPAQHSPCEVTSFVSHATRLKNLPQNKGNVLEYSLSHINFSQMVYDSSELITGTWTAPGTASSRVSGLKHWLLPLWANKENVWLANGFPRALRLWANSTSHKQP